MHIIIFLLFKLILSTKRKLLLLQQALHTITTLRNTKWRNINRFHRRFLRKLKLHHAPRPLTRQQPPRNQLDISTINIFDRTGVFEDDFEWIYQQIKDEIVQPRTTYQSERRTATSLSPRARLLLILHWLRHYPRYTILHILPILYTTLKGIAWPQEWFASGAFGTHGSVDCTSHYRWRVHPRQSDYYRGDKHAHFLTAQVGKRGFIELLLITTILKVVSDHLGDYQNVTLGLGHNNDQGMFRLTELDKHIEENDLYLLADGGYRHHRLITPATVPRSMEATQKDERSLVETSIGVAKGFSFAADVVRHSPEIQEVGTMVVYELAHIKIADVLPDL